MTFQSVNSKLLEATLAGGKLYCRRGTMVACTGSVVFSRSFLGPGGLTAAAARSVTGEGLDLMGAEGSGTVLLADSGAHVTLVPLRGETLYVEASSVLAYPAEVSATIVFQGNQGVAGVARGMMSGHGLWTTAFSGHGEVAIVSVGDCLGLPVTPEKPVFVDPQAFLGYGGNVSTEIVTAVGWKNLLGQGSGESFQFKFTGVGTVYLQASEQ